MNSIDIVLFSLIAGLRLPARPLLFASSLYSSIRILITFLLSSFSSYIFSHRSLSLSYEFVCVCVELMYSEYVV